MSKGTVRKTRKQKRDEAADAVCREVRFQLAHGGVWDGHARLFPLIEKWMRHANKSKYQRPIYKPK